ARTGARPSWASTAPSSRAGPVARSTRSPTSLRSLADAGVDGVMLQLLRHDDLEQVGSSRSWRRSCSPAALVARRCGRAEDLHADAVGVEDEARVVLADVLVLVRRRVDARTQAHGAFERPVHVLPGWHLER